MARFIVRRVAQALVTLLAVSVAAFVVVRAMPGDATTSLMAQSGTYSPEQLASLRSEWHLDDPLVAQYVQWLASAVRGDFGYSYYANSSVASDLVGRLLPTGQLAVLAVVFGAIFGMLTGSIAAVRRNTMSDYAVRAVSLGGLSIPEFWLASVALVVGAYWFSWLPPLSYEAPWENLWANLELMVPAALVCSLGSAAVITRLVRTSMLEVLSADYIRTGHAFGVRATRVVTRHGLRNALIPVLTTLGLQLAALLGGTVVIERVFNIPGVGRQTLLAIQFRDYPQLQMNILFYGAVVVLVNLLVDLVYGFVDPRVRKAQFST